MGLGNMGFDIYLGAFATNCHSYQVSHYHVFDASLSQIQICFVLHVKAMVTYTLDLRATQ